MREQAGRYIVIEGHDGTGKSTQVTPVREELARRSIESIEFHEPEGVPIADEIRTIIKNGTLERSPDTNLLLFTAARLEIWRQKAAPALKLGKWVVAARNYYSTLAYQGYGEGLDIELIEQTTKTFTDPRYIQPDISVILTLDDDIERAKRIANRGALEHPDTFESKDEAFQRRVQQGYLTIAEQYEIPVISAQQTKQAITNDIFACIDQITSSKPKN
jgi:dTMP kinase